MYKILSPPADSIYAAFWRRSPLRSYAAAGIHPAPDPSIPSTLLGTSLRYCTLTPTHGSQRAQIWTYERIHVASAGGILTGFGSRPIDLHASPFSESLVCYGQLALVPRRGSGAAVDVQGEPILRNTLIQKANKRKTDVRPIAWRGWTSAGDTCYHPRDAVTTRPQQPPLPFSPQMPSCRMSNSTLTLTGIRRGTHQAHQTRATSGPLYAEHTQISMKSYAGEGNAGYPTALKCDLATDGPHASSIPNRELPQPPKDFAR